MMFLHIDFGALKKDKYKRGTTMNTDLIRQILLAKDKNLPFPKLSLLLILFTIGSQNCFFLGLPPRYIKGTIICVQFNDFAKQTREFLSTFMSAIFDLLKFILNPEANS